jgi:hypothetical protein
MLTKLGSRATLALGTLALVVVAACAFKADFFVTRTFRNVVASAGSTFTGTYEIDLASEAPGAWKRRGDVKSLDLVGVEATVIANRAPASAPASGEVWLDRGATHVKVGAWTHTISTTVPDSITVTMPESGNALIMDALRNDGKFTVRATATTTGAIDMDVKVVLHVGVNYEPKL